MKWSYGDVVRYDKLSDWESMISTISSVWETKHKSMHPVQELWEENTKPKLKLNPSNILASNDSKLYPGFNTTIRRPIEKFVIRKVHKWNNTFELSTNSSIVRKPWSIVSIFNKTLKNWS